MKQKLTERYIINLMKEEWDNKVRSLLEKAKKTDAIEPGEGLTINFDVDGDGYKENVISPGLKVQKASDDPMSGLNYDVVSNDGNTVKLSRPDAKGKRKKMITITRDAFEADYKRK